MHVKTGLVVSARDFQRFSVAQHPDSTWQPALWSAHKTSSVSQPFNTQTARDNRTCGQHTRLPTLLARHPSSVHVTRGSYKAGLAVSAEDRQHCGQSSTGTFAARRRQHQAHQFGVPDGLVPAGIVIRLTWPGRGWQHDKSTSRTAHRRPLLTC